MLPVFTYLKNHPDSRLLRWMRWIGSTRFSLFLPVIPLILIKGFLQPRFPVTHALFDDWYTFSFYLVLFLYGYLLVSIKEALWKSVLRNRRFFLICAILFFSVMGVMRVFPGEIMGAHIVWPVIASLNLWSWILALFGYAAKWLNHQSRLSPTAMKPYILFTYCIKR